MAVRKALDGYPTSWGSSRACVWGHSGPASYTQVTILAGTIPVTGGDTAQAVEACLKYFDKVYGGMTDDGSFIVTPIPVTITPLTSTVGAASKTYKLRWVSNVTATVGGQAQTAGSEAVAGTNLSAQTVRLSAIGPK